MINAMPVEGIVPATEAGEPVDLVIRNGRVYTQDPARPAAAAIAVRDGRIMAVGDDQDMSPFVGAEPSWSPVAFFGGFHRTVPPTMPSGVRQAQALVEAVAESEEHRQWRAARGFTKDRTSYDEIFDSCFVL
jgi:predicted amidohydrolase YtcJ